MSTLRVNKIQPNSKETISIDGNVNITGSLVHNGHTTLAGTNVLSGSTTFIGATTVEGDLTVGGTLTAQEVRTEFDNAAVVFESGSTKFGNSNDDTHAFTGSLSVQKGPFKVTDSGDDVFIATPSTGTFILGDTQELGDGAHISGDSSYIKVIGIDSKTIASFGAGQYFSGIGTNSPNGTFHISHPTHAVNNTAFKVDANGYELMFIDAQGEFRLGDKGQNGDGGYIAHDSETFSIYSVGGTKIADFSNVIDFTKSLHIKADTNQDATITLESDLSNVSAAGDNDNPAILFKQDGGAGNAAVGFNIIDDTAGGTISGTGNRFWIVNSMADSIGQGGITFGTSQVNGYENAIARFMIRGDGKGLFGHPNANYSGSFDSQFEIYDDRTENTTSDYSLATLGLIDTAVDSGTGAGGIISRLKIVNGAADVGTYAISLVPGPSASEIMTTGDLAFYAGSTMDTGNATGFAGLVHGSSGNWQIGGQGASDNDTGYKLTVSGSTRVGDLNVQGTLTQAKDINFSTTACGIVWAMNTDGASIRFHNTSDGDTNSRLEFNTSDNNNEYFAWTHTSTGGTYQSMRLSPVSDGNSVLSVRGDITAKSLNIGNGLTNINNANNLSSSIAGGADNQMDGSFGFIGSGRCNEVQVGYSSVVGGRSNCNTGYYSTIGGGFINNLPYGYSNNYSTIAGGQGNSICSNYSIIAGGSYNNINNGSANSTIVGGKSNRIDHYACYNFIGGGHTNRLFGSGSAYSSIVGGLNNQVWGGECNNGNEECYGQFIGGGRNNKTKYSYAVIAGGCENIAAGESSIVGSGVSNTAFSYLSGILGGTLNVVQEGVASSIVGGNSNHVSSSTYSSVVGGHTNQILEVSNHSSILGGQQNTLRNGAQTSILGGSSNSILNSDYGHILGGHNNSISSSNNSVINAGGEVNSITCSTRSAINGGSQNIINGSANEYGMTIGGGCYNFIGGSYNKFGTIGGGCFNRINNSCYTTIGGGYNNTTLSHAHIATIAGGKDNRSSCYSFIGGGVNNRSEQQGSVIGGGCDNCIQGAFGSILGGKCNTITSGNCNSIIGTNITTPSGVNHTSFANNLILTGSADVANSGILSLERLDTTPSTLREGSIFHSGSAGAGCLYFSPDGSTVRQIAFV